MMDFEGPTTSKYTSMTVPQLKVELKKRGAKLSGRKKELIER
jgi:predicted HTH domain antitoxin